MEVIEVNLRSWGRSIGVVIPKETILKENLKEGDKIELMIIKKKDFNPIKKTFGLLKNTPIDTENVLKEADKELWDE